MLAHKMQREMHEKISYLDWGYYGWPFAVEYEVLLLKYLIYLYVI